MALVRRLVRDLISRRSQHLVFLAHVWVFAPFMIPWLSDPTVHAKVGDAAIAKLKPVVGVIVLYLVVRTYLAWKDPKWLKWEYVFPPLDVLLISCILYISHRGPLSNLTMLYFLPIIEASGSHKVKWAAFVGVLVVLGTAIATLEPPSATYLPTNPKMMLDPALMGARQLIQEDPLNASFRILFLIVIASLMTYQSLIAAEYQARLGVQEDRNRIALEMHDGVQGNLITLSSQLELIGHIAEHDSPRASELAKEARESAREAADELRFLVHRLRGPSLSAGFVQALRQYSHNVCTRHGMELEYTVPNTLRMMEAEKEQALFRIAQECMNNVLKHSGATKLSLDIADSDHQIVMTIRDNGKGFTPSDHHETVGLQSMKERAERAGGQFQIESEMGTGTSVVVSLPYITKDRYV